MNNSWRSFDRFQPIDRHGVKLPHWQQGDACVFVTFRLADSLPMAVRAGLSEFKANWLRTHGGDWTEELELRWQSEWAAAIDRVLDAGHGSCALRSPLLRQSIVDSLVFGNGKFYRLHEAVVMPNHVHLLFSPGERTIEREVGAWKSVSLRRLKARYGKRWPGWQKNYYDRLIRSDAHFARTVNYIRRNPPKAGLRPDEFWLWGGAAPYSQQG